MKKTLMVLTIGILVLGTMAMSFADSAFGPAQIYANLKGITEEQAYDLRLETGKTFGTLAQENGIYDEFLAASLAAKTTYINGLVASGDLTQDEADAILDNLANCDGTQQHLNRGIFGQGNGTGQGMMNGQGRGNVQKSLNGQGRGAGRGMMNNAACDGTGLGVTN